VPHRGTKSKRSSLQGGGHIIKKNHLGFWDSVENVPKGFGKKTQVCKVIKRQLNSKQQKGNKNRKDAAEYRRRGRRVSRQKSRPTKSMEGRGKLKKGQLIYVSNTLKSSREGKGRTGGLGSQKKNLEYKSPSLKNNEDYNHGNTRCTARVILHHN